MYKRVLSIGMVLVLLVCMFAVPAMASAEDADSTDAVNESVLVQEEAGSFDSILEVPGMVSEYQDNMCLTVTTNPKGYKAKKPISFDVSVQNLNKISVKNISLRQILPEGYKLTKKSETLLEIGTLKPGRSKTISLTCEPKEGPELSFILMIGLGVLFLGGVIGGAVLLKKKKRFWCLIPFGIGVCAMAGIVVILMSGIEKEDERSVTQVYSKVSVDGKELVFGTEVRYEIPKLDSDEIIMDFYLVFNDEFVKNSKEYTTTILKKGKLLPNVEVPKCDFASFEGWYADLDYTQEIDFTEPVSENITLYAKWQVDKTDSDGDGLYDAVEQYIGSDVNEPDTDDDGLNDYIEVNCGLNPCKADTNGDGTSDYEEDSDGDTLPNGYEVEFGANPALIDTDNDGLTDDLECLTHGTNPALYDTDGDGGSDFWEVNHGFHPLSYDTSFMVKEEAAAVSEILPVTAGVEVALSGEQAATLRVEKVDRTTNHLVRRTLPGYLGDAYEFTVEGEFSQATLSFTYDTELYGTPNEEFQPRIYYINEETGMYEELKNQVVENGVVKVKTTHFSKYILLNKVEFDKIWEESIRAPLKEGETVKKGMEIVLAIDYSLSMLENDPDDLRKDAAKLFLDKLGEDDLATVIPFSGKSYTHEGLTSDFASLAKVLDETQLTYGTNLSYPIKSALEVFSNENTRYKYIILLTDGIGDFNNSYAVSAKEKDIVIFTLGLGSNVSQDVLEKMATTTGGCYFHVLSAEGIFEVFEETAEVTIEFEKDSNGDGINDYYARLIREGKLPCADSFSFYDFDESPDIDGDGVLNGDELLVYEQFGNVYTYMKSNPLLSDTDRDGISDKEDFNPKEYSVSKKEFDEFCYDDNFYHMVLTNQYIRGDKIQDVVDVQAWIYGVTNKDMIAMDIMIDYFLKVPDAQYLEEKQLEKEVEIMYDGIVGMIDNAVIACREANREIEASTGDILEINTKLDDINEFIKDSYKMLNELSFVKDSKALNAVKNKLKSVAGKMNSSINPKVKLACHKVASDFVDTAKISEKYDVLEKAVYVADLYHTATSFSTISAECERFESCIGILDYVSKYSQIDFVKNGAQDFLRQMRGSYTVMVEEAAKLMFRSVSRNAVEDVLENVAYIKCILLVRDGFDLLFGISTDIEQLYQMFTYAELGRAAKNIMQKELDLWSETTIFGTNEEYVYKKYFKNIDIQTYMIYFTGLRLMGEQAYVEVLKKDGFFSLAKDRKKIIKDVDERKEYFINKLQKLNVPVR